MNKVMQGNNLELLKTLDDESVDLIATDPPYCSQSVYKDKQGEVQFEDKFRDVHEYIRSMRPVLEECHRVLKNTGSLYLIVDASASHYLKVCLDEIFGYENFKRHINWDCVAPGGMRVTTKNWMKCSYHILFYTKGKEYTFHKQYKPFKESTVKTYEKLPFDEEMGRKYRPSKRYPNDSEYVNADKGAFLSDSWTDIDVRPFKDGTGYPTQKPNRLIERIIKASSKPGDTVFDPFMGSGTTCVVAKKLHRNYIGMDMNPTAVGIAEKRLAEAEAEPDPETKLPENVFNGIYEDEI